MTTVPSEYVGSIEPPVTANGLKMKGSDRMRSAPTVARLTLTAPPSPLLSPFPISPFIPFFQFLPFFLNPRVVRRFTSERQTLHFALSEGMVGGHFINERPLEFIEEHIELLVPEFQLDRKGQTGIKRVKGQSLDC